MTATLASVPGSAPQRPVAAPNGSPAPIGAEAAEGAATAVLGADPEGFAEVLAELRAIRARLDGFAELAAQLGPVLDQLGRGPLAAVLGMRRKG